MICRYQVWIQYGPSYEQMRIVNWTKRTYELYTADDKWLTLSLSPPMTEPCWASISGDLIEEFEQEDG